MKILTITEKQEAYAQEVLSKLKKQGLRVSLDNSSDQISAKIKSAQLDKIPWMLVIGQKEADNGTVSVRYSDGKQEMGISFEKLIQKAHELDQF